MHERSVDSLEEGAKFSAARTKQLLRKMDINLVPFLALLYLYVVTFCVPNLAHRRLRLRSLSFLDRTNIGNARLAGLEIDLKMKGLDYNVRPSTSLPDFEL